MPNFTPHLQLEKPTPEDFYDVEVLNKNWDKIDEELPKRVPQTRTINKKPLSADVTLTGEDIPAGAEDEKTLSSHLAELDSALSNKVTQFGKVSSELFDNPTHPNGYFASVDDRETSMPNIPAAGHWRLLYLPYFAATEGWSVQIAVGAVENSGLCWRKARGAEWQPWEFAATATPPEEIPLHLADGLAPMQPSKYYKDQFGIVHISIAVKATTARTDGSLIATMPEGFRPTQITEQPAVYKNRDAVGTVQIMPNGQIIFFCTNGMMENQMLFGTLDFVT